MSLCVNINLGQCREFSENVFGHPSNSQMLSWDIWVKIFWAFQRVWLHQTDTKKRKRNEKKKKNNKQNKMHALVLDVCQGPLSWDIQARRARAEGEHAYCNERNCPWKFRTIKFLKILFYKIDANLHNAKLTCCSALKRSGISTTVSLQRSHSHTFTLFLIQQGRRYSCPPAS